MSVALLSAPTRAEMNFGQLCHAPRVLSSPMPQCMLAHLLHPILIAIACGGILFEPCTGISFDILVRRPTLIAITYRSQIRRMRGEAPVFPTTGAPHRVVYAQAK